MFFGCEQQGCYNEPVQGSFRHWVNGCFMTEQKKQLSRLCIAGFILSVLSLVFRGVIFLWDLDIDSPFLDGLFSFLDDLYSLFDWVVDLFLFTLPAAMFFAALAGFCFSIAGLISASRKGRRGKGFALVGIAIPVIYVIVILVQVGLIVRANMIRQQEQARSDIYDMGAISWSRDTEYDISQYLIPEGYGINSQDKPSSESELKEFAGSRLDSISKESDICVKGTYNNFNFLIIRRDRFDEWEQNEPYGIIEYGLLPNAGYAKIRYYYYWDYWQLSASHLLVLAMYKDPSEKFIIITNCDDYKVITEFFGQEP